MVTLSPDNQILKNHGKEGRLSSGGTTLQGICLPWGVEGGKHNLDNYRPKDEH